jgi:N-acetyl-gamma-glutamylphosphate reductase
MDTPMPDNRRLVIIGATGVVGGYALRYALEHPSITSVTAISRRPLEISHPKLNEVLHQDFNDCSALAENRDIRVMVESLHPASAQKGG